MKIVIAGGSGFIGKKLTKLLLDEGHYIQILTRKAKQSSGNVQYIQWLHGAASPEKEIGDVDVFINLAGVSINEGRWSEKHKEQIYHSRMEATDELLRIISLLPKKPSVFINASAIGIYPASIDTVYTEDSLDVSDDFLGKTVFDWEAKAKQVEAYGARTVFMRFGVVLGNQGGALPLMVLPYKMFVGGTLGHGKQWVSWVHVADVVRAIHFVMNNEEISGPVNVTAPSPVQMKDFGEEISSVLHRPHWLPIPSFLMKIVLGQKSALVLEGQHVLPQVLVDNGYSFIFPSLHSALEDLLKTK